RAPHQHPLLLDTGQFPEHTGKANGNDRDQCRSCWIASHPFLSAGEDSRVPGPNRFVTQPAFKIFGQRESEDITTLRIFLEAFQTDSCHIAIDLWIPEPR